MQNKITVSRPARDNKGKIMNFRLTDAEANSLLALKERMGFNSLRDFIVYATDVLDRLHEWRENGDKFFKGKSAAKLIEVEFEFNATKEPK